MKPALRPLQRAGLWLVLLAVLLSQTLGLLHRQMHGDAAWRLQGVAAVALAAGAGAAEPVAEAAAEAAAGLVSLFGAHGSGVDCQLFDAACGEPGLLADAPPVLPALALPAPVLAAMEGLALARRADLFDARGPPFFR